MARRRKRGKRHRPASGRSSANTRRTPRWVWWASAGVAGAAIALLFVVVSGFDEAASTADADSPVPLVPPDLAKGEALYAEHCASCHGANLEGQPNWKRRLPDGQFPAPPHDETGHTWHHANSYLFNVTKRGGQATAPEGFISAMPGFEDVLSDHEIWSILAFIQSRWPAEIRARQPR